MATSEVSIRELNQQTSSVLGRVRSGKSVIINDRGVPIAVLKPLGENVAPYQLLVQTDRVRVATRGAVRRAGLTLNSGDDADTAVANVRDDRL